MTKNSFLVEVTFNFVLMAYIKKKNFMAPFYGWGSTASRLEPLPMPLEA